VIGAAKDAPPVLRHGVGAVAKRWRSRHRRAPSRHESLPERRRDAAATTSAGSPTRPAVMPPSGVDGRWCPLAVRVRYRQSGWLAL